MKSQKSLLFPVAGGWGLPWLQMTSALVIHVVQFLKSVQISGFLYHSIFLST